MRDHHRHDKLIWALIFSLVINVLFVFAFLSPRTVKKAPGLQAFVVTIDPGQSSVPENLPQHQPHMVVKSSTKTKKPSAALPVFREPSISVDPLLLSQAPVKESMSRAVPMVESPSAERTQPPTGIGGESEIAQTGKATAGEMSIFGDKTGRDHYTAAEYLMGEKPPYPKRAERNGWEGTVLLSLSINANGEVEKVGIAQSSGYELLDDQARQSVTTWRFSPARRNGTAIPTVMQQPIIFRTAIAETKP